MFFHREVNQVREYKISLYDCIKENFQTKPYQQEGKIGRRNFYESEN